MARIPTPRTVTKHFAWTWDELPSAAGAAWSEEWTYAPDGELLSRRRLQQGKRPATHTISTDPRAGAIMREEIGLHQAGRPMGGPHW
ncbi:MAG: hypothetical protein QOI63_1554 [Thermoplasmata archaeon]|jgi:putative intracellular protease/amidase|nr:hypothetical protein [Thermoplasmata archaeon]